MGVDVLPRWERLLYWIGGIGSMLLCYHSIYRKGQEEDLVELQPGVKVLGGKKDSSDPEWSYACHVIYYGVPLLVGHTLVGQILHSCTTKLWVQKTVRLVYDVLAIVYFFGVGTILLCVVEAFIMYLVTAQRHTCVVWLVSLLFTTTLNVEWMVDTQLRFVDSYGADSIGFFISISYFHIRLISSATEIIKHNNCADKPYQREESVSRRPVKKSNVDGSALHKSENDRNSKQVPIANSLDEVSILDYLTYIFYLPVFFQGPILNFDTFLHQVSAFYHSQSQKYDVKVIVKKICKIALITLFIEFQSHFMYIHAIKEYSHKVWRTMSVPSTIGLSLWQGQYFHLKYLCIFGIPSVFYTMDGIEAIPLPACISWIYSFSDMWTHFDVGLYRFIKTYIYIPWGGSRAGISKQIFATILAFSYVCYWHGAGDAVLVWCCGNLIIILLEIAASHLEKTAWGTKWKSTLGAPNVERLKGLVATPIYVASAIQVMFFFFSYETGTAIVEKMILKASWKALLLEFVGFYCAVQNGMLIRKWYRGKQKKP